MMEVHKKRFQTLSTQRATMGVNGPLRPRVGQDVLGNNRMDGLHKGPMDYPLVEYSQNPLVARSMKTC